MPGLTQPQIDAFLSDGYLVIDEAFPKSDLDALISEFSASVERNAGEAFRTGLITETFPSEPFETRLVSTRPGSR